MLDVGECQFLSLILCFVVLTTALALAMAMAMALEVSQS